MSYRLLALGFLVAGIASSGVASAAAATRCVGHRPGCFHQLQPALDAAHDGDTIAVDRGVYDGGVTVTKSVRIVGAGRRATTLRGGGPVVTVGSLGAASEPTVAISDLRVTGGRTTSSQAPVGGPNKAVGGGLFIPPGADGDPGATVTLRHVVVAGNLAAPGATQLPANPEEAADWPACPSGPCPYAEADGGGIANFGNLTLRHTVVRDNAAAGRLTSDADGGGIYSDVGSLTVRDSAVVHNRSASVAPNGRYAEGGGLKVHGGTLDLRWSVVRGNASSVTNTLPSFAGDSFIELQAQSGGIQVGDGVRNRIDHAFIANNAATTDDPNGEPLAFDAAMIVLDTPIDMRDSVVRDNVVRNRAASSTDPGPGGSAVELDGGGTITRTRIVDNPVRAVGGHDAGAAAGLALLNFNGDAAPATVSDSVIAGNTVDVSAPGGSATAQGGGVLNDSLLELRRVIVEDNAATAHGSSGASEGGGIWNGTDVSGPPVELTLVDSLITRNRVGGGPGIALRGGGLFTTEPVTRTRTRIAGNRPDDCSGC